jgi:hypothetical protein
MRAHCVAMAPPVLNLDLSLLEHVDDFAVDQLITQVALNLSK